MEISIETVEGRDAESAMWRIRRDVFEGEMGIALAPPASAGERAVAHLLALAGPRREPVGTLSLIDTSGEEALHAAHGLGFRLGARAARFKHLAVLRPYRGRNIPLMMMLEAYRLFVAPRRFEHTWLLFDAERAPSSFLVRLLSFRPKADVFLSEYGARRPLLRDERAAESARATRKAREYLEEQLGGRVGARPAAALAPAVYSVT